ncbi:hypothetical protein RhiirC2_826044, partial [Rhizophagus irregularis]
GLHLILLLTRSLCPHLSVFWKSGLILTALGILSDNNSNENGTHLLSWSVIYANSTQKRGNTHIPNWYKNLSSNVTIPNQPGLLQKRFMTEQRPVSQLAKELAPCTPPPGYKKNWIVTINDDGLPIFGKQIQIQPKHSTYTIVHWTSDCLSRLSNLITLQPCLGCNLNINKSSYSKKSVATSSVSCSYSASLRHSWILPMKKSSITSHTSRLFATVTWAEIMDFVTSNCNLSVRSVLAVDTPNTSIDTIDMASSVPPLLMTGDIAASSSVVLSSDSHYIFYTNGSLINLGSKDVSMGWDWVQIVKDSGFLNFIATYKRGIIHDWPSSSRAEAAAIYAALSASPANSVVHIYTDSQSSIEGLKHCFLFDYSDSCLYYKTTNFELWAIIQKLIVDKNLSVLPFKVKAHSNFYWNDFADSLANTAHTSEEAVLIFRLDLAAENVSRHHTLKFQLFLKDLPTLELLKRIRPDLYVEILTCHSCEDHLEDFMHLFLCEKRHAKLHQLLTSYLHHLTQKLKEAGIPHLTAMNVVAAIHNNFVNKFRKRIWNPRSYDKGLWEHVMNITSKLKQSLRPKGWSVDFNSGHVIRYYVSIVASTLVGIYQGGRSRKC